MTITRKLLRAEQITTKTHSGPKRIPGFPSDIQQTRRETPTQRIPYQTYFTHTPAGCQGNERKKFRQHRKMGAAGFGGASAPIAQYEKWEIHLVFPHFPYFRLCQNTARISLPHYAVLPFHSPAFGRAADNFSSAETRPD